MYSKPKLWMMVHIVGAVLMNGCRTASFVGITEVRKPEFEAKSVEFVVEPEPYEMKFVYEIGSRAVSENFTGGSLGQLDLLVVVDDSGSMREEQQNLATKLSSLLTHVGNTDWKIGVNTTTVSRGCLTHVIATGAPDAGTVFLQAVNAGANGSTIERGIYQAVSGLKGQCLPQGGGWVRPKSTVAVLIVSDEDNCHDYTAYSEAACPDGDFRADYLIDYLSSIRSLKSEARVYGIIMVPGDKTCTTGLVPGYAYEKAVTASGGTMGSICSSNYSEILTNISKDVSQIIQRSFAIKQEPLPDSLQVSVGGTAWTDYEISGTTIHFTKDPKYNDPIVVTYRISDASQSPPVFSVDPAPGRIISVRAGNSEISSAGYQWTAGDSEIILSSAPNPGDEVVISYEGPRKSPVKTILEKNLDGKKIEVTVDGKPFKDYQYSGATGEVVLAPPPPVGADVRISYQGRISKK